MFEGLVSAVVRGKKPIYTKNINMGNANMCFKDFIIENIFREKLIFNF